MCNAYCAYVISLFTEPKKKKKKKKKKKRTSFTELLNTDVFKNTESPLLKND